MGTVTQLPARRRKCGKRTVHHYLVRISSHYLAKVLKGFRGEGAATFFRQHTEELWDAQLSTLSIAEYGAWRRLLAMFARSAAALRDQEIVVTAKELRMHGISMHILRRLDRNVAYVKISLLTESGEIKDL
jgi:hypothetical protein